jgi:Cd2+/Zn2+-exporting ATPase
MDQTLSSREEKRVLPELWKKHSAAIITAVCLLFIVLAWCSGTRGNRAIEIVFYILAYIVGGHQKAIEGFTTLFKEKDLDVDLLMVVAAVGAASIGYWMDGAILIFIFSLSGALEEYTMERTNRDIKAIMKLRPEEAVLLVEGVEKKVKTESLKKGDVILVRPGERISADGIIIKGYSAIDEASITGESIPADKKHGDEVYSGTMNGQGALEIQVTKPAEETVISKIIHLVQQAKEEQPPSQQFVEHFEGIYAKVVVAAAVLLMVLPPYLFGWSWSDTIYRAMIFLVVASPCALVSSIMPAILSGISNAARQGVLFKGGVHLENMGGIKAVAFDKTGTLTFGKPKVMDIVPFTEISQDELLRIAASVETLSQHPIAKAVVRDAQEKNILLSKPQELQSVHGVGVYGIMEGKTYSIGKKDILEDTFITEADLKSAEQLEGQGKTVIFIAEQGKVLGVISLKDIMRPRTEKVIAELKSKGIRTILLTGDTKATANAIAGQADIDEVYAELMPEDKLKIVRELEKKYGKTAMVGDGVNDAPALAAASVGIAMGSGGTDVAMETADVILINDDIASIPFAVNLGRRSSRVIKQNIVFAIMVALTLITLNFIGEGKISLPEGVIGHEGSTVLVILSGLRLLK